MLFPTSFRGVILACPSYPCWSLPFFAVESTVSSPCSYSDRPLCRDGAILAHLDSLHLTIWLSGQMVLFLLAKVALAYLPTALCDTEDILSFSGGPVCLSFSTKACSILQTLRWFWQHQQVCHFSSLWLSLSPRHSVLSFALLPSIFLAGAVFSFLLYYQATMGPRTFVSLGKMMRLMSWPDGEPCSCPLQSLVVSLVSTLLFSQTGDVLSHLISLTHRFPRFPLRNLCSLVTSLSALSPSLHRTQPSVKLLCL